METKTEDKEVESVSEVVMNENLQEIEEHFEDNVKTVNFEELQRDYFQKKNDTTYVINFWATWCKPCIKELPVFEKVGKDYSKDKVKVILVSLDFADKIDEQVKPFMKKNNIRSEVVLLDDDDANAWIPKVSPKWSGAIPATVIFKNDTRKFFEQSFTFEELENELKPFL